MTERSKRSRAPWIDEPDYWGRIRLTRRMWIATYNAVEAYLRARWRLHYDLPNPSPESRASLDEIRELEKVVSNLQGLGEEKGWALPVEADGHSETGPAGR